MADFYPLSKIATTHQTDFAELTKRTILELQEQRHWISDKWTDTDAGKDHEVKILDYACGAGTVSKVRYRDPQHRAKQA